MVLCPQIVKTTDAGKTWSSVFFQNNTFFFNQIACGSEQVCVAAGEGEGDSSEPGVRIWVTHDGGASWTETLRHNMNHPSLMSAFAISETEYWVGGGEFSPFVGVAYHSVDAGLSWVNETVHGVFFDNIDCVGDSWCAASTVDSNGQSSFLTRGD